MNRTFIDKLAFIEIQDRKVLVTLSKGKDTWYIPGGKREMGEDDVMALVREIEEELAVVIEPETASLYGEFEAQAHGKPEGTIVRMTCYRATYEGTPVASGEIEKLGWFGWERRFECAPVDVIIFDDLKHKGLID